MSIDLSAIQNLGFATTGSSTSSSGSTSTTTSSTSGKNSTQLDQSEFLKLMTMQMTHQDPLQPMQNTQFLSQMAQFGTVSGIQQLQSSFQSLVSSISSDQALQAASLVGKNVSVPSNAGLLSAGGEINGTVDLSSSAQDVTVSIIDPSTGTVVKTMDLGGQSQGSVSFAWNGLDSNGVYANPGVYKVQVQANINGTNTALQPNIAAQVQSVNMNGSNGGVQVNLAGLGSFSFNQIKQIL